METVVGDFRINYHIEPHHTTTLPLSTLYLLKLRMGITSEWGEKFGQEITQGVRYYGKVIIVRQRT